MRELCQHVPEAAAAQGGPTGCQARVRIVPPAILHHVHCVLWSFAVHGPRRRPPLPVLRLSWVGLVRRLSLDRIGFPGIHRVTLWGVTLRRVTLGRESLCWVALRRRWALGRISRSRRASVRRGLLKIHLCCLSDFLKIKLQSDALYNATNRLRNGSARRFSGV